MTLLLHHKHSWEVLPQEAIRIQRELCSYLSIQPLNESELQYVGGVDTTFCGDQVISAAVILSFPSLERGEQATASVPANFPYIPGLLSFREASAILTSLEKIENFPDLLLVDGHGLAHPRRFGIACHIGVLLDIPSIGCAKSLLVGKHDELPEAAGSTTEISDGGELLGMVVRTRKGVKPVYVSVGHKVDLRSSVQVVLACSAGCRLPEPTRQAHILANQKRHEFKI